MGYWINFWTFSKKKNSTEQPNNYYIKCNINADLMNGSGILNPSFQINEDAWTGLNIDITTLNYAEVPELERYYYITNWKYNRGLWICEMMVDVLASFKSSIGATTTYILRSASNYDRYLPDNLYPAKVGASFNATTQNLNPFATTFSSGYFVVGIINGDSSSYGAVSYYVFTSSQFRSFANTLLGSFSRFTANEISDQLGKMLFNPFQYIVSCTWLPIAPPMGSGISTIPLGWWSINGNANRLGSTVRASGTVTITIPKHPDSATRKYLLSEPYSQYYLDFPPFGNVTISADLIVSASYLDFYWTCDCITGEGKLSIGVNSTQPFTIMHGQIGVPIQLAQMSPDIMSAIQQILPSTGNDIADSIINTLGNIGSAMIAKNFPMQSTGGTGGFMGGYYPIRLTGIFHSIAQEELSEFGAPCCQTLTISTLSGYVLCAHGDFIGNCTTTETDEINNYLTSGFFYE